MVYIAPSLQEVGDYLDEPLSTSTPVEDGDRVVQAIAAETAAQLRVVRLPVESDPLVERPYPADLAEALCRRVAHNLALRSLPLGLQASVADGAVMTNFVGGTDAEVRRLEAPFRRRVVG